MARSRSPRTPSASTDVIAYSFMNCAFTPSQCACRCPFIRSGKIELLQANKQVQAEKGSRHGSWKFGEDDDLIVCWHFRGRFHQIKRHRYARIPSTDSWQLVEVGDFTQASQIPLTFLFPVAQGTTDSPLNFIHHARLAPQHDGKFRPMALLEAGTVQFKEDEPHGSWYKGCNGDLVVHWECNGEADNIKKHRYHKLPQTNVWRLSFLEAYSVQDDTLLIPSTPVA